MKSNESIKLKKTGMKHMLNPKNCSIDNDIHYVYHKFETEFYNGNGEFRFIGYDLIKKIEAFVKKNPSYNISIINCDDNYHTSSIMVLIPHMNKDSYWGTTLVIIPQLSEMPTTMFLYPNNAIEMQKSLLKQFEFFVRKNIY